MMNEILGAAARLQQGLTRKFGVTGGSPSPQVTPEITPVYPIPHLESDHLPSGVVMAAGYIDKAATALKQSVCQLRNPPGTNVVLVVTHLMARIDQLAAGHVINASINQNSGMPSGPAAGGVTIRDTRVQTNGGIYTKVPVGLLESDADPAFLAALTQNVVSQAAPLDYQPIIYTQPVVLSPGWALTVYCGTQNTALKCVFHWDVVPLAAGEVGPF